MDISVGDIARLVGGEVVGDSTQRITGVNGIQEARAGEITYVRAARYAAFIASTQASAVIAAEAQGGREDLSYIITPQPDLAFAQVLKHCEQEQQCPPEGLHPQAVIADTAALADGVAVGALAIIEASATLAEGAVVYAGAYVGHGARIGPGAVLYPRAVVRDGVDVGARCVIHAGACIGSDGFGFAPLGGEWFKIPQVGGVLLGDDVEVGSNTCIDRATFGLTRIGRGTKIDNLVQIGHNVQIGEHCAIAGTVGIAGSAVIGNHVRIGASAGINGHIDIGDGAAIGARAGVTKSVEAGQVVSGFPAMDHNLERRVLVAQKRAPETLRRLRQLERQVQALEKALHEQAKDHR